MYQPVWYSTHMIVQSRPQERSCVFECIPYSYSCTHVKKEAMKHKWKAFHVSYRFLLVVILGHVVLYKMACCKVYCTSFMGCCGYIILQEEKKLGLYDKTGA